MSWPTLRRGECPADVTLLLEGTYPMVRGGVSGWVDQVIRGLPQLRFALVFIGGAPEQYEGILYDRPENVVHLECHYLLAPDATSSSPRARRGNSRAFAASRNLHEAFRDPERLCPGQALQEVAQLLGRRGGLTHADFLYSQEAWQQIVDSYHAHYTDPSFVDYFWSVRNMHAPLFKLVQVARNLPPSHCLHAISTGYAGFLGALAHHLKDLPFVITEHGIYTKERHIDLIEAAWIKQHRDVLTHDFVTDNGYLRQLWIRFFEGIGRLAYSAANPITTLYGGNRDRQLADGAPTDKLRVIPNGIRIERFRPLRESTAQNRRPIVTLIGRITPIKDIKTFIRAMHLLLVQRPDAEGWIVGPDSEDPAYAQECRDLVKQLGLEEKVIFKGFQRTEEMLAQSRLVVLTSISEAQPLVVLESLAAGVPVVCSDVGSCRELVYGERDAPRQAGRIVPIAHATATAGAMLELLNDDANWLSAREVGIRRVEEEFTEAQMLERYRQLYEEAQRLHTERQLTQGERSHGRHWFRTA